MHYEGCFIFLVIDCFSLEFAARPERLRQTIDDFFVRARALKDPGGFSYNRRRIMSGELFKCFIGVGDLSTGGSVSYQYGVEAILREHLQQGQASFSVTKRCLNCRCHFKVSLLVEWPVYTDRGHTGITP